jgi:hypothetical protein
MEITIEQSGQVIGRYRDLLVREESNKPWYVVLSNGEIPIGSDFYLPPSGEFIVTNPIDTYSSVLSRFKEVTNLDEVGLLGNGSQHIDKKVDLQLRLDRNMVVINHLLYINVNSLGSNCEKVVSSIAGSYNAIADVGGALDVFDGFDIGE